MSPQRSGIGTSRGSALLHCHVGALLRTGVDLPWTSNPCSRVTHHFAPVSDPPGKPAHSKEDGKHSRREPECLIDNSGVKVDVRIQPPLNEVIVAEGNLLKLHREIKQRIGLAKSLEDLGCGPLHY